jgi:acetyl-CoA synthetase
MVRPEDGGQLIGREVTGAHSEPPAWRPDPATVAAANLTALIADRGLAGYPELHRWSVEHRAEFWGAVVERLGIVLRTPYRTVLDDSAGPEQPRWLVGAELNIVESCFTAPPDRLAVVHRAGGTMHRVTYGELWQRVDAAASGLSRLGVGEGDRVAIAMPMTLEAVVAYLAVVAVGGAVVSIADSFAPGGRRRCEARRDGRHRRRASAAGHRPVVDRRGGRRRRGQGRPGAR